MQVQSEKRPSQDSFYNPRIWREFTTEKKTRSLADFIENSHSNHYSSREDSKMSTATKKEQRWGALL